MNITDNVPATTNSKKYSTIIIITLYPLSERYYQRFGIDTFLKCGYVVKVLDVYPLFTKNYAEIVVNNRKDYEGYKQILSINELRSELNVYSPDNCLIIIYIHILYNSLKIYNAFKK